MAEQIPLLSPEIVDLAWEAAVASNGAYDKMDDAQKRLSLFLFDYRKELNPSNQSGYEQLNGVQRDKVEAYQNAGVNFKVLTDIAGLVMKLSNTPFASKPTETLPIENIIS